MPCRDRGESTSTYSTTHERYEERFSTMPWTAIPFSDLKSRKRLERIFGIFSSVDRVPVSIVINPRGVVVQSCTIDIGDRVNLSDLLFTKTRDYLIKYKDNQLVKHNQLAGKVIILHFVSLVNGHNNHWDKSTKTLVDIYNNLESKGGFEVVFVAVRDDIPCRDTGESASIYSTHERYEEIFSTMPWTAIPFSDLKSRKRLERLFGIFSNTGVDRVPVSFVIDPTGVVVQSRAGRLFSRYGAACYPFTKERLECLDFDVDVNRKKLSISILLASPERDYVITNKGDQVPLHKLEDKVVGLFFLADILDKCITWKLKKAYEESSKNKKDFEVVLIPISSKTAFLKTFEAMPWLAIPYKDKNCIKKLLGIFEYPLFEPGRACVSRLVIVEPHGKFIEPFGAHILMCYGIPACPFTRFSAVKSKLEDAKDVKPEMFWDLDAVFTQKNGSQVRFSQIVGKRIMVLFCNDFDILEHRLRKLKALYIQMKGTNDEFEVIHIRGGRESERVAEAIPWLMHPPFDKGSDADQLTRRVFNGGCNGIIAFDCDGRVVRMTPYTAVAKMVFPFYSAKDMEDEVLLGVNAIFDEPLEALLRCW